MYSIFISSLIALMAAGIPLWINALARHKSTGELFPSRSIVPSPFGFLDVIAIFFLWFAAQMVSVLVAAGVLGIPLDGLAEVSGDEKSWLNIISSVGILLASLLGMMFLFIRYRNLSVVGFQPIKKASDVVAGLSAFVMCVPMIMVVQIGLTQIYKYEQPTLEMLKQNQDAVTIFAGWFGAVLVAPIWEEFFFRGVFQAWLQRINWKNLFSDPVLTGGWETDDKESAKVKQIDQINLSANAKPKEISSETLPHWPILVSSALFALAHLGQGPAPIPLFLFGLVLGYLYRKTGSLVPCLILHMMLNGFNMLWFTIGLFAGEPSAAGQ